ncbi:MAG: phosphate ABC transporter permease subunit PstC [Methermicoccaceae archaeon]
MLPKGSNRRNKELAVELLFTFAAISTILLLFGVFIFLANIGIRAFAQIHLWDFLAGGVWNPDAYGTPSWGIFALIVSTLLITSGALVIAIPLGIACAVYLSELASSRVREFIKPTIEMIASIPSVVLGVLGLLILAPVVAFFFGIPNGLNALAASILVAVLALPTIISISEDALSSVPLDYRAASYALGATKWQTIRSVVVPAATSGIIAASMLGMGTAIGETMVVLMVAGNTKAVPMSLLDPARTMTANIAIEIKEVVVGSLHYEALFAIGLVLFLLTFLINFLVDIILSRYEMREAGTA